MAGRGRKTAVSAASKAEKTAKKSTGGGRGRGRKTLTCRQRSVSPLSPQEEARARSAMYGEDYEIGEGSIPSSVAVFNMDDGQDGASVTDQTVKTAPTKQKGKKSKSCSPPEEKPKKKKPKSDSDSFKTPEKVGKPIYTPWTPKTGPDYFAVPGKIERLCELWQTKKFLYVPNAPYYKDKGMKDAALAEFSAELQIPVDCISKRLTSLRSDYQKIIANKLPTGSGRPGELSYKKRIIKDHCYFLYDYCKKLPSESNYKRRGEDDGSSGESGSEGEDEDYEPPTKKKYNVKTYAAAQAEKQRRQEENQTDRDDEDAGSIASDRTEEIVLEAMGDDEPAQDVRRSPRFNPITPGKDGKAAARPSGKVRKALNMGSEGSDKKPKYGVVSSGQKNVDEKAKKNYLKERAVQHRPRKKDEKSISEVLEGRDKYYEAITKSVIDLTGGAAQAKGGPQPVEVLDPSAKADRNWADTILYHMSRMDGGTKDFFTAHVFDLCMRAVRKEWPN